VIAMIIIYLLYRVLFVSIVVRRSLIVA
jgi:hypothetical protein